MTFLQNRCNRDRIVERNLLTQVSSAADFYAVKHLIVIHWGGHKTRGGYMSKVMRALLIILIFSSIAEASNWQLIRPLGAENYGFYIDMDSIRGLPKGKVRFWYTVAKNPESARKDTGRKTYVEMDCLKKRYRDITFEREQAPIVWENIAPDSFEESFYGIVCHK
jgi:hypothetical protein